MGFGFISLHEHVIHIDFHIPIYLLIEHLVHQSLEVAPAFFNLNDVTI